MDITQKWSTLQSDGSIRDQGFLLTSGTCGMKEEIAAGRWLEPCSTGQTDRREDSSVGGVLSRNVRGTRQGLCRSRKSSKVICDRKKEATRIIVAKKGQSNVQALCCTCVCVCGWVLREISEMRCALMTGQVRPSEGRWRVVQQCSSLEGTWRNTQADWKSSN